MLMSYSHTTIIGNLGEDPKMRYTPDGTPVCNFSVAVNRQWTNQDGTKGEETTWFTVTTWQGLAESCNKYLKKGRQVFVAGKVTASAWKDREGEARATLELTARDVRFLGGANGEREQIEPAVEEMVDIPA